MSETTTTQEYKQPFFKFYDNYIDNYVKFMTGEQVKKLLIAVVEYHQTGFVTNFDDDPIVGMALSAISANIDRDEEKYKQACLRHQKRQEKKNKILLENGFYEA